ncbi:hypothetical protein CLAFUW4_10559 [Fulvia fulva]|nr:hypothetical protein CLAFUR4_10564 [Fulvia fulva]WPV18739.1 hypothetical protein CLAFUW4_10559 [Fulvia fulva]WPV33979.1 hypothetical protein CLAFUW7_10561 [Fulvia fulva]
MNTQTVTTSEPGQGQKPKMSRLAMLIDLLGDDMPQKLDEPTPQPASEVSRVDEKIEAAPVKKLIRRICPTMETAADFEKHIAYLKGEVANLEAEYHLLPLQQRRDIRLLHAEERLMCAAIFQHKPSLRAYDHFLSTDGELVVEPNRKEPSAEICPTTDYYVHGALRAAQTSFTKGDLEVAEKHLREATTQLDDAEEMLSKISGAVPSDLPLQDGWQVLSGWNDTCYFVQKGVSLTTAIERALRKAWRLQGWGLDNQENGGRQYFPWHPSQNTKVLNPIYPANLPGINDMSFPKYKPTPDEWEHMFAGYKTIWADLSPHDSDHPSPLEFMADIEHEHEFLFSDMPDSLKVKTFFLRGAGFESTYFHKPLAHESEDPYAIWIGLDEDLQELAALERYLHRVEIPRWHSDRINKRTGVTGEVDEGIARSEEVKTVWNALRELRIMIKEGKFVHAANVNSNYDKEVGTYKRTIRTEEERERLHREIRERWDREEAEERAEKINKGAEEEGQGSGGGSAADEACYEMQSPVDWVDDVD